MKIMGNNDTLSLKVEENDISTLHIIIENSEKNSTTRFKLNLMDLHEENIEIPPPSFESVITMPSLDFQKICRDMPNLAEELEIKSIGNQLIFNCQVNSRLPVKRIKHNGLNFIRKTIKKNSPGGLCSETPGAVQQVHKSV